MVDARQPAAPRGGRVYVSPPRPPEDDWITVAAESFLAVIEAGDGDRGVGELIRLARLEDAALETIVSAIPIGVGGTDSFAVVHFDRAEESVDGGEGVGRRITAVARGRAVVDVFSDGGSRRFWSSGVQPWLIATFRDVIAVELGGPARRTDAVARLVPQARPIETGVSHVGAVLWSATDVRPADADGTSSAYLRPGAALDEDTVRSVVIDEDVADAAADTAAAAEETVRRPPAWPQGEPQPVDNGPDEETVVRPPALGEAGGPVDATESDATESGEASSEEAEVEHPTSVLVGVHGAHAVLLDAPIIFGRRPTGTARGGIPPLLVTVASRDALVSASHVRVERAGRVVVVTDLRSRNGTAVILPGAAPRRLRPGESFAVPGAAEIDIGDGTIIEITPVTP
ncbi:FHA domain-containing protein [Humibacter sp. RRB41]|uniref:FHA domain-containing protein n=1 Tax=Humibacter sp. RRB41 TaxID=2919946 RepID=UPI001FAA1356|nr:FHA domain-containing protein [Humibacter sp. RRB41]